ncbi:MAG: hypothetical protein FJZ08_02785 [Candidatus Omnitrophica bacterium]|nr:hypothetical protein [Candidatus Omnitrophota bacterium]
MKRIAALAILFVFFAAGSQALAHPPSDIIITYDPASKILKVVITHQVGNPQAHFINKVDVFLNGKEIITQHISRQDNNNSQAVSYLVPDALGPGKLSVKAYCSISGRLEKEIEFK